MAVKVREWKGAWWLFVDHGNRRKAKRVGVGRAGKKAAEAAALQIQAKLAEGNAAWFDEPRAVAPVPAVEPAPVLTFATLAEDWLTRYPLVNDIRPSSLENYTVAIRRHLIPYFGPMPVAAITYKTVEDFIAVKLGPAGSSRGDGKPLARITLKVILVVLQMVLQRAVKDGVLQGNPAVRVGRFRRVEDENVDPFSGKELRAILEAAQERDPDLAALLRLWAQTGARAGEVCALQWQDVDLELGTARIRQTWTRRRLGPTKTGTVRTVSLCHPVLEDTPEWRPGATSGSWEAVGALRRLRVRTLAPDGFVFTRRGQPWPQQSLHTEWRRVLLAAGVRYRSPEQFRHTFASTMLSRNAPLLYVQAQGGWKGATVLLRVYSQWMPQDSTAVPGHPAATPAQPETARGGSNVVSLGGH